MILPCSPQQFAAALAALKACAGVTVTPKDADNGSATTPKVDFSFAFNGTQLMILITKKHGAVKSVPDATVYAHIQDELMQVKA